MTLSITRNEHGDIYVQMEELNESIEIYIYIIFLDIFFFPKWKL